MDRRAWGATVYGIAKNQTQLSMRAHTHIHTHNLSMMFKNFLIYFIFWLCWIFIMACGLSSIVALGLSGLVTCGILVPQPGIEHVPLH